VRVVPPSRCNSSNLRNLQVPKTPHVPVNTIRNIRSLSIRVKVRIICHGRKINAHAILDSGAKRIYCNISFINAHKIPTSTLAKPIYPRNVDGTLNKQGPIRHTAILRMEMGEEHKETTEMAVTNIGQHDILLGTDWFRAHNPQIDWAKNKLRLDCCPTSCYPNYPDETSDLAHLLPTEDLEAHYDDLLESKCYDPGPYHQFSSIFYHFILRSQSLALYSFPHAPLGPPPNHLTSHLMDHLTIPQSTITCHHSAVRSIPQHHHLTLYGLPAHNVLFLDHQLMMELYLEPPRHDLPY